MSTMPDVRTLSRVSTFVNAISEGNGEPSNTDRATFHRSVSFLNNEMQPMGISRLLLSRCLRLGILDIYCLCTFL